MENKFHHIFLVLGIALVAMLAYLKELNSPDTPLAFEIPNVLIEEKSHSFSISQDYISNALYAIFCKETGYTTWRERLRIEPTWRRMDDTPSKWQLQPVQYLNKEDALAFCYWIGKSSNLAPRLPTVKELLLARAFVSFDNDQWEWTLQDMSAFEPDFPGAAKYLTTWNPSGQLRHRTTRDMNLQSEAPNAFHIIWDESSTR